MYFSRLLLFLPPLRLFQLLRRRSSSSSSSAAAVTAVLLLFFNWPRFGLTQPFSAALLLPPFLIKIYILTLPFGWLNWMWIGTHCVPLLLVFFT